LNFSSWAPHYLGKGSFYDSGNSYSCHDPRRPDKKASFSVSILPGERQGKWCDFAGNGGGDLKFLCKEMGWDAPDEIDAWTEAKAKTKPSAKKESSQKPTPTPNPTAASSAEREEAERRKLEAVHRYWDNAGPPDGHAYLERKGIPAGDVPYLRRCRDDYGKDILIVPGYDVKGELRSIERISATAGEIKKHLGPKTGAFCGIRWDEGKVSPKEVWAGEPFNVGLVEGFATGWALDRMKNFRGPVYEVFGQSCFPSAIDELKKVYGQNFQFLVFPDMGASEKILERCREKGAIIVSIPEGEKPGTDWHDVWTNYGAAESSTMFHDAVEWAMLEAKEAEEPALSKTIAELRALPPTKPLIEGFLPSGEITLTHGAPGSGKTFTGLDAALPICCGLSRWHEFQIIRTAEIMPCLYLSGEGRGGILLRIDAWAAQHGITNVDEIAKIRITDCPINLLEEEGLRAAMREVDITAQTFGVSPVLITVDTLARHFGGGDENSTRDMNTFIMHLDKLKQYSNRCAIHLHHHSDKQGNNYRGSSALMGAMENAYYCTKKGNTVVLDSTPPRGKRKDLLGPDYYTFNMVDHTLPNGVKCALEFVGTSAPEGRQDEKREGLTGHQKVAYDTLHEALRMEGVLQEPGKPVEIHLEKWRPYFKKKCDSDGDGGTMKKAFQDARKRLVDKGIVSLEDGFFSFVLPADCIRATSAIRERMKREGDHEQKPEQNTAKGESLPTLDYAPEQREMEFSFDLLEEMEAQLAEDEL